MKLARITQNPVYISVLHSIHDNIHQYYDRFLSMEEKERTENYHDLKNLVDAVVNRQVQTARRVAQKHVERFNAYMRQKEIEEKTG